MYDSFTAVPWFSSSALAHLDAAQSAPDQQPKTEPDPPLLEQPNSPDCSTRGSVSKLR